MAETFADFGTFLFAVWDHLFTLFAGCVATVMIAVIAKYLVKRPLSWREDLGVFSLFLFFACFQAWHDQFKRANDAQHPPVPTSVTVNVPPPPPAQVVVEHPSEPVPKAKPSTISYDVLTPPNSTGAQVFITARGTIIRPRFQITCEEDCSIGSGQSMVGATAFESVGAPVAKIVKGEFHIPSVLKDGQEVLIDVVSRNGKPVKVERVRYIRSAEVKSP